MSFKEKYPLESLINENVEEVFNAIERLCSEEGNENICVCKDCILDVAAIALNNLSPRYRVFLVRAIHRDEDTVNKYRKQVEETVRRALGIVKDRPHHEK